MQNLRSALRILARSPGFTTVAIVTLALGTGLSASSYAQEIDNVGAVLAANDRLTEAADRLDTDALFAGIVDSDETRIIQDGKLFKARAEAVVAVRAGSQGVAKVDRQFESPHVTVLAPGVALFTAEGTSTATLQDGRRIAGRFAVSLVFVLRDGEWKLFHGHYSLPNPQP